MNQNVMQANPNQGSAKDGLSQPTVIWYFLLFLMRCSPPKLRFQAVLQVLYPNLLDLSLANIRVTTVRSVPFGLYISPLDSKVPKVL